MNPVLQTYNEPLLLSEKREPLRSLYARQTNLKPNVFIAGAQKAGTTSLVSQLVTHPEIAIPKRKEIYFFNNKNYFDRGSNWYYKQFNKALKNHTIQLDATANYFESMEAPQRIANMFPKSKIIILLRNPVHRAFSHYRMSVKYGFEYSTFDEALALEASRLEYSRLHYIPKYEHDYTFQRLGYRLKGIYHTHLLQWQKYFSPHQLLVLQSENYFRDPEIYYKEILDFLGLETVFPNTFGASNIGSKEKIPLSIETELSRFYAPHNKILFNLLQTTYDW